jgi:hypothetical protein
LFSCLVSMCFSAQIPSDLSMVNASQISDTELCNYLKQEQAAGLTVEQLGSDLTCRGVPSSELQELQLCIPQLDTSGTESGPELKATELSVRTSTKIIKPIYGSF